MGSGIPDIVRALTNQWICVLTGFRGDVNGFQNVFHRKKERGSEGEMSKLEKSVGKVIIHSSVHL